jgi:hypothetical protein
MAITLDGTAGMTLPGAGTSVQAGSLTLATAQTASGTNVNFTGIPSWVKRITVMFNSISGTGTAALTCRLGTSVGLATTGYFSVYEGIGADGNTSAVPASTTAFGLVAGLAATNLLYGTITVTHMGNNIWTITGTVCRDATNDAIYMTAGSVTLTGICDRVGLTWANGTDTFDAGTVNIMYE